MNKTRERKRMILLCLCCLQLWTCVSQVDSTSIMEDGLLDSWEMQVEEDVDMETVSEDLLERLEDVRGGKPPNLNDLTYEVAVNVLYLTDYQYYQLQLYVEEHGPLYTIFELDVIDGFTAEDRVRLA